MNVRLACFLAVLITTASAAAAFAQPQAPSTKPDEGPGSDTQLGASFVGNSGNAQTATLGADFSTNYRAAPWRFEAAASAVRNSGRDVAVPVNRYLENARIKRDLTPIMAATAGERLEHDPNAGVDLRSIVDAGLAWKLVRQPSWTLDAVTAIGWNHEHPIQELEAIAPTRNDAIALLQGLSKIPIGATGSTTQRVTWYPDFTRSDGSRVEAEVTAQAAMNQRLALKVGYLIRYVRVPLPGRENTDTTATASIVLTWKNPPTPPKAP